MKFLILSICAAMVAADVSHIANNPNPDANAKILSQQLDTGFEGQYEWSFETENGISASQKGSLNNAGFETEAQVAQGSASWTAPDGQLIQLQYIADENGYQPQGEHLPTPPPIPPAILRALEYIRAHPPPVETSN